MPTILFIDDHTCGSHTVPQTLRACGYEVQVAPDAREALTLFRLYPIDAVVTDCNRMKCWAGGLRPRFNHRFAPATSLHGQGAGIKNRNQLRELQ